MTTENTTPTAAAIYCRTSTGHQGAAQERQVERCEDYLRAVGLLTDGGSVTVYTDTSMSGSVPFGDRPGGAGLLALTAFAEFERRIIADREVALVAASRAAHEADGEAASEYVPDWALRLIDHDGESLAHLGEYPGEVVASMVADDMLSRAEGEALLRLAFTEGLAEALAALDGEEATG
ncbi:MAG: recombinase family protein [Actinomycetota bacterium]